MSLDAYITAALWRPFVWGQWDCITFAIGWLQIRTGRDWLAEFEPWHSARQALRQVHALGGLERVFDAHLARINPHFAGDGDLGLYRGGACLYSGARIVGPCDQGLNFLDRTESCAAWQPY